MSNYTGYKSVAAGLGSSLRLDHNERYVFTKFRSPVVLTDGLGGGADSGDAVMNYFQVGQYVFQMRSELGNGSALVNTTTDGLLLVFDATNDEGGELTLGRTITSSDTTENTNELGAFTVGTDAAFFLRVKLDIATVASSDQICVGFATGAPPATGLINANADFAGLNVDNGNIINESRLNGGSDVATDSTDNWADADQKVLEIWVSENGVVKLWIDGADPTVEMAKYTFDDGDVVHAFLTNLNDTTADPTITVMEWESGFLSSRGLVFSGDQYGTVQGEVPQSYLG